MSEIPEYIRQIIHAAVAAPSGDNSQPWRFVYKAPDSIEFHALPEYDNEILNVDSSGTLISLGAAYENARIEASTLGYQATLHYSENKHMIRVHLQKFDSEIPELDSSMQPAIDARHSNRNAYKEPLKKDDKEALLLAMNSSSEIQCTLVEEPKLLDALGRDLTVMEEIALSNPHLHKLFFKGIFWSKEDNENGRPGLYIKTLELPPPAQVLFRGLRHWNFTKRLSPIGFSQKIAETNAKQNASASAYIFINVQDLEAKNYIEAGRVLERVWLTAANQGLSCQIVSGILFLARRIEQNTSDGLFEEGHKNKIAAAYRNLRSAAHSTYHPLVALRVGYAKKATARSRRKAPNISTS
jgi:nitroreductase